MLDLADRNLLMPLQGREARYAKYYERNPLGPPSFFLARETESQAYVGMAAVFPTRLRVFGELVPGAISGDFAVDDGHRGFGPSVALQRAVVSALGENGLRCAYGYPNEHSEPIVKRVGYVDLGRLTRFVKVLRSRVVVERYIRSPGLARLAARGCRGSASTRFLSVLSRERLEGAGTGFASSSRTASMTASRSSGRAIWREHAITSERNARAAQLEVREERAGRGGVFTIFALVGATNASRPTPSTG